MPWEEEGSLSLRNAISSSKNEGNIFSEVSIIIGPEGGFTHGEAELARRHGVQTVSLGRRRISRAETAAIAAVTAVCYELGEWDL